MGDLKSPIFKLNKIKYMEKYKKSSAEKNMIEGTEKIRKEAEQKAKEEIDGLSMNCGISDEQECVQEDCGPEEEHDGSLDSVLKIKDYLRNTLNTLEGESLYLNDYYRSGCIDTIKMILNQL
jgi:hypothetical protein